MVAKDTDGLSVPSETKARRAEAGEQLTTLGGATAVAQKPEEAVQPPEMWRSLEEYADVQGFRDKIEDEFPRYAPSEWEDESSRRSFLKLAGASMGLAAAACTRQPQERIVPYVEQPENYVPGKPMYFASALPMGGTVAPVIAESHMGRPTKLAGNPEHPFSQGATDLFTQAAVLDLYDPDRSSTVEREGRPLPWETMVAELAPALSALEALGGEGVRILSGPSSSPSFLAGLAAVRRRFPRAEWVQYESVNDDAAVAGSRMAFDTDAVVHYDYSKADVVLSLDADFLNGGAAHLRSARDFAAKRNVRGDKRDMNRLYVVETTPSGTGTLADHRLPVRPSEVLSFAAALAGALGVPGAGSVSAPADESMAKFLEAAASDLAGHRGSSAVVAGDFAAPEVHALAHAINDALGNVGSTVVYTAPAVAEPSLNSASLARLVEEIEAGEVQMLAILGGNPVYDSPGDVDFAAALERVPLSIHLGMHKDETGALTTWHVPQAHALEAWGDGRTVDGTLSITQPLIEPLFNGRSAVELLDVLAGGAGRDGYQLVQATWREAGLDGVWREALHDGFVEGSALEAKPVTLQASGVSEAVAAAGAAAPEGLEIAVRPDPSLYDGRFANNGWLQELSKPITKISWDQTVQLAPAEAAERGLDTGDVVSLVVDGRSVEAPVWIVPGQAKGTAVIHMGYGREFGGRAADGNGQNAQKLRSSGGGYNLAGDLASTGRQETVASTQEHYQIDVQSEQAEKRHLVRHGTIGQYEQDEHFVEHVGHHVPVAPMFERWEYNGHAWGMVVDLSSCTGCNACIIACQAENNIPVVGRDQIIAGREMAWLRIDRYFQGDLDAPAIHHQPVACQHCEQAPCEVVCPVGATVHSDEGLNDMVYNRCIGTRYCSNNCPYKVRRFNFFKYQDTKTPVLKLQRNPNVSVRARGVMEKCSYCTQRINAVRQQAKVEGRRPIQDGEVQTACQEICPSNAIAFGDLNDPNSEVAAWKKDGLGYALLDELDTLPRTTYLAKINNPHPSLDTGHGDHGGGHGDAAAGHGGGEASTDDDHGAAAADDHAEPAAQH